MPLRARRLCATTETRHLDRLGQLQLGVFEQDSNTDSEQESNTDSHSAPPVCYNKDAAQVAGVCRRQMPQRWGAVR